VNGDEADPMRPRAGFSTIGWRRTAFTVVVLVVLGVYGFVGIVLFRPDLIAGILGHEIAGHIEMHFRLLEHRVHDLTFGFLHATTVVGLLAQLRHPSRNIAGQWMALTPLLALLVMSAVTDSWVFAPLPILAALTLLATLLHPVGSGLLRSLRVSPVSRTMLVLLVVAAVPLLAFAFANIGFQRTVVNAHSALGHYAFMAAFGFTVVGVGGLATLRPHGWRLAAWLAALLPALLGLASLIYPDVDSSLGTGWALAAILWGVAFVTTAELTHAKEARTASGVAGGVTSQEGAHHLAESDAVPRWMMVLAIVAAGVVLLIILLLVGVFGGEHGPGRHLGAGHGSPLSPRLDGIVDLSLAHVLRM
jgi:hypothetical protein